MPYVTFNVHFMCCLLLSLLMLLLIQTPSRIIHILFNIYSYIQFIVNTFVLFSHTSKQASIQQLLTDCSQRRSCLFHKARIMNAKILQMYVVELTGRNNSTHFWYVLFSYELEWAWESRLTAAAAAASASNWKFHLY